VLIAGIDEAGYGPRLGPLCVGLCAFEAGAFEALDPVDLWAELAPGVGRWGDRKRAAVVVDDSKKLKGTGARGLEHLERAARAHVGAMDAGAGAGIVDDESALGALGAACPSAGAAEAGGVLCLDAASAGIAANVVRERSVAAGVRPAALRVEAAPAARLNEGWRRTRSKAAVELELIGPFVRWVWERAGAGGALVTIDRLGGRTRYGAALSAMLPGAEVEEVAREEGRVVCRAADGEREMFVEVLVGGDGKRYCCALASVAAKWSRELIMARFNAAFCALAPELKPTAGYGVDANRWIREARAALGREVVDPVVRLA